LKKLVGYIAMAGAVWFLYNSYKIATSQKTLKVYENE